MRPAWILGLAITVGLTAGAVALSMAAPGSVLDDETPRVEGAGPPERGVVVSEIRPGDSAEAIAEALAAQDVIASAGRFEALVSLLGYEESLEAGRYDFEPGLVTTEVIERLHAGMLSPRPPLTIREGLRLEEIAEVLAAEGTVTGSAFLTAAADPATWAGTVAGERPEGVSLEGYLLPGTYQFSLLVSGGEVVRAMLERLERELTPATREAIAAGGRTVHEVLTVASLVEREAVVAAEQPLIASVFWNRLRLRRRLEADPTVQYALAQEPDSVDRYGYWKAGLTLADLAVDSPYNTYRVPGLPPTPIAAPGAGALSAAIRPAETDLLYFVARGDGSHAFATTFADHLLNVERFQPAGGTAERER